MRERVLHSLEEHFLFCFVYYVRNWDIRDWHRPQFQTHTSRASHTSRAITPKGHAGWVCLSQRLRNLRLDAWKCIFLVTTVVRFKFSQYPSLPLYSAFQLEFVFKPSVPEYKTKYLRLKLAPKKKTLAHNINNVQPLMISICSNSHLSKHSLVSNV